MSPSSALPSPPGTTPLALPGAWVWSAISDDVDAQAKAQPHWRMRYEQLSPGRFSGELRHVQLPGLRLVREQSARALRQRGDLGRGSYGFALSLRASPPAIFYGQRAEHQSLMVGRGDELDLCTPEDYALIAAVVDHDLIAPLWERLYQKPLARWLEHQVAMPARPDAADALRRLHLDAMTRAMSADAPVHEPVAWLQLRDAILIEWIEALPEAFDAARLTSATARKRIVDRACELLLDPADRPLSMLEVCRRVGVSRRKLNYCFQHVLGTSPVKYLRAVRLHGVRRDLLGDSATVQDAATRWGFWHLGQFSLDYKRQFGELPSATLKGARGAR